VQAFQLGAQDYITYPIIPAELLFRLKSIASLIKLEQLNAASIPTQITAFSHQNKLVKLNKYAALVDKTCQFLMDNLAENYSLNELSALMLSNRNTLSKAFKQELGISAFAWLRFQRMKKAKMLLAQTHYSIQEISALVGYEDPANFSTAFRSMYDISPNQYRQWCIKQKSE